jgi:pSer/pThr/pTyr-binding forkhead associated (FHA) protein
MKLSLVVTQGTQQGKAIPITKAEFVIGRDAKCHLRPASQHVSKRHCVLRIRDERVFVEDLKSTNGTVINDEPLTGEREVHDGDHLKIGPLDFLLRLEAQAERPTHVEQQTQVPGKPAQAPAKPQPAGGGEHLDDDAIGSMLLSMTDEQASELSDSDSFATGSTVMQVLKPEELEQLQSASERTPYRPRSSNQGTGNTSSAAKAILEKYRRRPKA